MGSGARSSPAEAASAEGSGEVTMRGRERWAAAIQGPGSGPGHAGSTGSPVQAQGTRLASRGRAASEAPVLPGHQRGHFGHDS